MRSSLEPSRGEGKNTTITESMQQSSIPQPPGPATQPPAQPQSTPSSSTIGGWDLEVVDKLWASIRANGKVTRQDLGRVNLHQVEMNLKSPLKSLQSAALNCLLCLSADISATGFLFNQFPGIWTQLMRLLEEIATAIPFFFNHESCLWKWAHLFDYEKTLLLNSNLHGGTRLPSLHPQSHFDTGENPLNQDSMERMLMIITILRNISVPLSPNVEFMARQSTFHSLFYRLLKNVQPSMKAWKVFQSLHYQRASCLTNEWIDLLGDGEGGMMDGMMDVERGIHQNTTNTATTAATPYGRDMFGIYLQWRKCAVSLLSNLGLLHVWKTEEEAGLAMRLLVDTVSLQFPGAAYLSMYKEVENNEVERNGENKGENISDSAVNGHLSSETDGIQRDQIQFYGVNSGDNALVGSLWSEYAMTALDALTRLLSRSENRKLIRVEEEAECLKLLGALLIAHLPAGQPHRIASLRNDHDELPCRWFEMTSVEMSLRILYHCTASSLDTPDTPPVPSLLASVIFSQPPTTLTYLLSLLARITTGVAWANTPVFSADPTLYPPPSKLPQTGVRNLIQAPLAGEERARVQEFTVTNAKLAGNLLIGLLEFLCRLFRRGQTEEEDGSVEEEVLNMSEEEEALRRKFEGFRVPPDVEHSICGMAMNPRLPPDMYDIVGDILYFISLLDPGDASLPDASL